jgi:glucosylceramidase
MNKYLILCVTLHFFVASFAQNQRPQIIETAKDNPNRLSLLSVQPTYQQYTQPNENENCIFIDSSKQFQQMIGIGAAITDAAAETFGLLNKQTQQQIIDAFFDDKLGIGYNLLRTTIHSSDFSSESYTYIKEGDSSLNSFSIAHDLKYRIPFLKSAFKKNTNINLFASPWSPPAFMKSNQSLYNGGKLLPQYYQSWANYFVRFIAAYEKAGIPIWGLSIQNEPMAKQRWESCIFTAEEERDFLKYYLGPTLKKERYSQKKIIAWDHNRDLIYQRANTLLSDLACAQYIWGIGYHWYETWAGGTQMHQNLSKLKEAFPSTDLIFTEGCKERFDSLKINNWDIGVYYAKSMIRDFNAGTCAWTDWNILLNQHGGPNHKGNFCFAPVHVNTNNSEITYTSAYYYIGHFSKYIKPGARRLACSVSNSFLEATAFKNIDGSIVLIVLNDSDTPIHFKSFLNNQFLEIDSQPNSIQSILF